MDLAPKKSLDSLKNWGAEFLLRTATGTKRLGLEAWWHDLDGQGVWLDAVGSRRSFFRAQSVTQTMWFAVNPSHAANWLGLDVATIAATEWSSEGEEMQTWLLSMVCEGIQRRRQ